MHETYSYMNHINPYVIDYEMPQTGCSCAHIANGAIYWNAPIASVIICNGPMAFNL